ncbi:MAG: tetratricopeptide repeat protein [Candidatus Aminicenantales bacterium]
MRSVGNIVVTGGLITLLSAVLVFGGSAFSAQTSQSEEQVEKLLTQAEAYYQRGDYKLAIGCYIEASALAEGRLNLSRAYFGLALSYFYLRDMANSTKWIRRVCEVDPKKEISELFYPRAFVQLYNQVCREVRTKSVSTGEEASREEPPPEQIKTVEELKTEELKAKEEASRKTEEKETVPPKKTAPTVPPPSLAELKSLGEEKRGGHWEVGVHYSLWSVNLIKGLFESALKDELGEELQNELVKKIGTTHAGLLKSAYAPTLSFDSEGSNYGLEIRFYSRGRAGTFSLGFSLEKTIMRFSVSGKVQQSFTNGSAAAVDAEAYVETRPFSTHFSFRWDISSSSKVCPYFVIGLGFAPLKGEFYYTYSGNYQWGGVQEEIKDSQTKTFTELSEDIDFKIPENILFLQINFGMKINIYEDLYLAGEAGIWNGFLLRAGLAYRF